MDLIDERSDTHCEYEGMEFGYRFGKNGDTPIHVSSATAYHQKNEQIPLKRGLEMPRLIEVFSKN